MSESVEPTVLTVIVGGYVGDTYGVHWEDQALFYDHFAHGFDRQGTVELHPSPAQWQRFWATLDRIGVWQWGSSYRDDSILDGPRWYVEIEVGAKRIESYGSNAYPERVEISRGQAPFQRFCRAVSRLVGGRAFH